VVLASETSSTLAAGWVPKPVAVLAIAATWPDMSAPEAGPYEPWTVASRWEQRLAEKVAGFGGVILQGSTSLLLVAFGLPHTLDQLPQRAIQAALAIRHLAAEASALAGEAAGPVVRLAGHLGTLLVAEETGEPPWRWLAVSETLALPVRLLGHAAPGEILLSPGMGPLVEGWYDLQAREVLLQGGQPGRIGAYAVVGNRPQWARLEMQGRRPLSPFVGRDQELATLCERLHQMEGGRGQVVGVIGEPGIGKSRLCDEFVRGALAHPWLILAARGTAYGQATPYLPIIDLLKGYFHIDDRDDRATVSGKVTAQLHSLDDTLTTTAPAFLMLLDVPVEDPQWQVLAAPQRRQRTLDALAWVLVRESQVQPVLLVFEDLHWIDTETQAFLDTLVESLPTAQLLLLVNYRPEYRHSWGHKTYYRQLRLDPLPPASADELLQPLLGDDPSLAPAKTLLIARTEGNPFFLEESVHSLVETGVMVGEPGHYRLAQVLPTIEVPATVQAVLAARIDRLPLTEKRLLQTAAVIGHEIPLSLLHTIAELSEDALHRGLTHLQVAEFLYETRLFPDRVYTFKHALTRQVAYQSLLRSTRQRHHQRIAQVVEARFPEVCETQPELLAHHYTEAGLGEQAVVYWQRAGRRASQRSAYIEAISHLAKGLEVLETLPDSPERTRHELVLQTILGPALMATKGYGAPEVEHVYARARVLCQQGGDTAQLFPVLWGLWYFYTLRAELQTAREMGEQLLALVQGLQDSGLLLLAHRALGQTLLWLGELVPAHAHLARGIALHDPQLHHALAFLYGRDPGVDCLGYAAWTLWCLGYPDQALTMSHQALTLVQELPHPHSLAFAVNTAALLHVFRREGPPAHMRAQAAMTLSTEQGFPQWLAVGTIFRGWALTERGALVEGLAQIASGLAAWQATGAEILRPCFLGLLAEAHGKVGRGEEGLRVLAEALTVVLKTGERWYEAELHRLKGELLLQQTLRATDRSLLLSEAEACFRQALNVSGHQQAKALELRAAMSLARLWRQQGKQAEARELLAPIYGWFTEGFDTADLREAKALLRGLS
jgi:predicted ATPase/class 3 adenylate cyclase